MYIRVNVQSDNYGLGVKDEFEVELDGTPEEFSRTLDAFFGPPIADLNLLDLSVFGVRN